MSTPFDLIYETLIQALHDEGNLFKARNVIAFDDVKTNPSKAAVQTADLPEVVLYLSNVSGNFTANSSSAVFVTTWRYMLSTGDYNSASSHKLMFSVLRIHADWKESLASLLWKGKQFVKGSRLVLSQQGLSNAEQNRNISGFASVLDLEVDICLNKADFIEGV